MAETNTLPLKVSTDLVSTDTVLMNVAGKLSRVSMAEFAKSAAGQYAENVLPIFVSATYPAGIFYEVSAKEVANQAARLVAGIVSLNGYVYQTDTNKTYQLTSNDGDQSGDWTEVGDGYYAALHFSNGRKWIMLYEELA